MPKESFLVGDKVKIKATQIIGKIIKIQYKNITVYTANQLSITLKRYQIEKLKVPYTHQIKKNNYSLKNSHNSFNSTLDLHGMTLEEAKYAVNYFLDQGLLYNTKQNFLKIIHGKGKGVLKKEVQKLIAKKKEYKITPFYIANPGITVLEMTN